MQGYLGITLLLTENDDMMRLVINSMRKDLESPNEVHCCLALHAIANIGGKEIAESLGISEGAVKTRVFRAQRLLRKNLKKLGIEP